jgi:putative membrane protein insertion efficiency factor
VAGLRSRQPARAGRALALGLIRAYQLTLSGLIGRQCRHLPSCSEYTADAIRLHGVWPGVWMGGARICRCGPFGTSGLDFVCEAVPERARWYAPWRYGRWRGTNALSSEPAAGAALAD